MDADAPASTRGESKLSSPLSFSNTSRWAASTLIGSVNSRSASSRHSHSPDLFSISNFPSGPCSLAAPSAAAPLCAGPASDPSTGSSSSSSCWARLRFPAPASPRAHQGHICAVTHTLNLLLPSFLPPCLLPSLARVLSPSLTLTCTFLLPVLMFPDLSILHVSIAGCEATDSRIDSNTAQSTRGPPTEGAKD